MEIVRGLDGRGADRCRMEFGERIVSEVKKPTAREIDALLESYSALQDMAKSAAETARAYQANADRAKASIVEMVEAFGEQHSAKSKKLRGDRHSAMTTIGTVVSTVPDAVEKLRLYVSNVSIGEGESVELMSQRLFSQRVSYQLVDAPSDVLASVKLPGRVRARVKGLIEACFRISTKAPSLKVELAA